MSQNSKSKSRTPRRESLEGWHGWDEYAPFYDWENARTLGRRDVPFWVGVARQVHGRVLELGCGTGRISRPLVDAGVDLVGVDRSEPMLARHTAGGARVLRRASDRAADRSAKASRSSATSGGARGFSLARHTTGGARGFSRAARLVRGDIRELPFADRSFAAVLAPYGILQSLVRRTDLTRALASVARILEPGGMFGVDLVPDVPRWREYRNKVQLQGRSGDAHLTLVESVRQDRRRRVTTFEQCYVVRRRRSRREHRFELTFRTLTVPAMRRALVRAGFSVASVLGSYDGQPWDPGSDVWIITSKKG